MNTFTEKNTPAQIVRAFPKGSDIFKDYGIDFCCGGDKPLIETFNEQHLNGEQILYQLNGAYDHWKESGNKAVDWDAVSSKELIGHVVDVHHAYLKEELPRLGELVARIDQVHGANHIHLQELHDLYNEFRKEMEEHTIKEEEEVFPLIAQYELNPSKELLQKVIEANGGLEDEHDEAGNLLKQMRTITEGFTPPPNACGTYRIAYARLAEMEENTFQHIHLENNILFERIKDNHAS